MSTYLTYDERLEIEAGLKEGLSFGSIGKKLGKDRTTIAKEIKKHSYEKKSGYPGWPYNPCQNRYNCVEKKLCNRDKCRRPSTPYCKYCSYCHEVCNKYEEEVCVMKVKPPYVCNACGQLQRCSLKKTVYDAYN